jgi:hypothetical protein
MAEYKVPQDVEADDKLIGPFSFRQFIYLIIVALAGAAAWGLYQLFPLLIIIPLPIILFFGALALPLRKDQPMEIYLAAMVSFYLKPRKRLWDPDGIESLIEITVPKVVEQRRTKDLSQSDAQQRFGYLAEIVDSQGWAIRGQQGGVQAPNSAMNTDVYYAAQQAEDILDSNYGVAQSLDYMISKSDDRRRQEMIERMRAIPDEPEPEPETTTQPTAVADSADATDTTTTTTDVTTATDDAQLAPATDTGVKPAPSPFNFFASQATTTDSNDPYPANMQQKVIQPLDAANTSGKVVSADIMNLANDADLSIATIAHEANRINNRNDASGEVVVSLR